jgi:hypothetical protein
MYGYGFYKMNADELYDMDCMTLSEMFLAVINMDNKKLDDQMQVTAWQTALLMNATGNYKLPVKSENLYVPLRDRDKAKDGEALKETISQERTRKQEELMKTFGLTK